MRGGAGGACREGRDAEQRGGAGRGKGGEAEACDDGPSGSGAAPANAHTTPRHATPGTGPLERPTLKRRHAPAQAQARRRVLGMASPSVR